MIEFTVPDMSCNHCVGTITKTVQALDANAKLSVDLASKQVKIESNQTREVLALALTEEGFPPSA